MDRLLLVSLSLALTFLFRQITLVLEKCPWWRLLPSRLRTSAQYYSFLYVSLACVLVSGLIETGQLLAAHPFLDPSTFTKTPGMPEEDQQCPRWLMWLSLGTPLAVIGSLSIGTYHTMRHARAIRMFGGGLLSTSVQRDRTVQVVAFPAIFSLTSFNAVVELWCLLAGYDSHGMSRRDTRTWSEKEGYVVERYTALFAVAALYEAYALLVFVWLSLDELEANMRITAADAARAATSALRMRSASLETADTTASLTEQELAEAVIPDQQHTVVQVMRSLTMQGVLWFVLTCFLDAIYDLYVVQWAQAHNYSLPSWAESGEMCFYGMGFITSSAAITNVVSVEGSLHAYFGDFRCAPKFLSCKIMVSIAFLQSISVAVLSGQGILTDLQKKMLYASLICYEVLALSCFHLYAWPEDEPWLQNTEKGRKEARARWKYAVNTMSVGQKMLAWLQRARERLAQKKIRSWRQLPSNDEEPMTSMRSAPPAPSPWSERRELQRLVQPRLFAVAPALPTLPIASSGTPPWYSPRTGSPSPTAFRRSHSSADLSPHCVQMSAPIKSGPPIVGSPKPALLQVPLVAPPGAHPLSPLGGHPATLSPTYMTRVQSAGPAFGGSLRVPSNPHLVHVPSQPQMIRLERL